MTFMEDIAVHLDSQRSVNNIGYALKELLQRANESKRVVVGVMECVQNLQSNPDEVNLCILTETDDVTAQIHHKLVEAFCWENDIEVIKIEDSKKLEKVLSRNGNSQNVGDIACALIQNAETDNFTNEFMENYYSMLRGVQSPIINLPE